MPPPSKSKIQNPKSKITLVALGSRGDVQPFVALGQGLRAAGHRVRIAAAADYSPLVQAYGLEFAPLAGSIRELMDWGLVYDILDAPGNPLRFGKRMLEAVQPLVSRLVADCRKACAGADMVVASTLGVYIAYDVAEALGIPLYAAHMHPYGTTRAYPQVFFPTLPRRVPLRGRYNRITHWLTEAGFWTLLASSLNAARREVLALPAISRTAMLRRANAITAPVLLAYSPLVAPRPRDWAAHARVTGYWFLDREPGWQPPQHLVDFLASGPPPVYVSFGSNLAGRDPDGVTRLIMKALAQAGVRGVLSSGWGDLGNVDLPESVLKIGAVPHDWLFPRMSAVVHHGGAGTTAAALRASVPSVVVPFFGDQRFWARRVHALGAAPAPIPRPGLTADRLAQAIRAAVCNPVIKQRATRLGKHLERENGVQRAIEALGVTSNT
ncbi:MAG: glycosyltransferase [Chloroflexota bacterium]|nr:glycosyltransferase [Chloroflexota bacterium]MDQ5866410.1 glycosyltransferase [Chloroflexota bacterium]